MKDLIINSYLKHLKSKNLYSKEMLEKIEYSLAGIYLTFSKMLVIFLIAAFLGIFKEMLMFMIFFNILRTTAFGIHASKSWICLISSIICFIGIPILAINVTLNIYFKIILCINCIVLFYIYAPADTQKRPIINKKRRLKFKMITVLFSVLFSTIAIFINNNFISNSLIFAMIVENILILPVTYKIFNMPYKNYISYLKKHPELIN